MDTKRGTARVAEQVRAALAADDLDAFADLLDPDVTWGAPGDPSPTCQNRNQVLRWYRQGRAEGRRGRVLEVSDHEDKILVSMMVTSNGPDDTGEHHRWQVLTVASGRVVDIRGYDDADAAAAAAGVATKSG